MCELEENFGDLACTWQASAQIETTQLLVLNTKWAIIQKITTENYVFPAEVAPN